jgi:hypothetical protein
MTYFKLKATGVAVALALSAQANAFVDPATAQVRLYLSGASAPTHMLREQVVQNLCDDAAAIDVFVDGVNQVPGPGGVILNHTTHWVVQCIGETGTPAAGQRLLVAKSDVGGSAQGVNPVALAVNRPFINTAACGAVAGINTVAGDSTTAYTYRACGTASMINQIPDMGVSDIEPDKFTGTLNDPATGDFLNPPASWQVEVGPGLLFGIVVSTSFRNELQQDQFGAGCVGSETAACMPDLPSWYVRSVFAGKLGNWNGEEILGGAPNVPGGFDGRVHICRRVQGSGTHAQHMVHFARTNCNRAATLAMPAGGGGVIPGQPLVFENSSSGNVDNCLNALETGAGAAASTPAVPAGRLSFGIGYQSLEKNVNRTLGYRFVKIDGVAPTLENAFNGDYSQVYFLSYNHRENDFRTGAARPALNGGEAAILEQLIDSGFDISGSVASQINAGFVHSFGASGFVVPVLPAAAPAAFNPANPVVPFARRNASNTGPDSCAPIYRR